MRSGNFLGRQISFSIVHLNIGEEKEGFVEKVWYV